MLKKLAIILSALGIVLAFGFNVFADMPTVRASGTLTSFEQDGSVIISEKGYILDPSARILDRRGRSIPLKSLQLPVEVDYQYMMTSKGFVIVEIRKVRR